MRMSEEVFLYGIPYDNLPTYAKASPVGDKVVEKAEEINFKLLDEILEFIKVHPTVWKQAAWFAHVDKKTGSTRFYVKEEEVTDANSCGTSFCFAGHVAIASGFPAPPKSNNIAWARLVVTEEGSWTEDVSEFAQNVLGLDYDQADALFDGANDLGNLEWIVAVLHRKPNASGDVMSFYKDSISVDDLIERYDELVDRYDRYEF